MVQTSFYKGLNPGLVDAYNTIIHSTHYIGSVRIRQLKTHDYGTFRENIKMSYYFLQKGDETIH
jgi:hypothetical protein